MNRRERDDLLELLRASEAALEERTREQNQLADLLAETYRDANAARVTAAEMEAAVARAEKAAAEAALKEACGFIRDALSWMASEEAEAFLDRFPEHDKKGGDR